MKTKELNFIEALRLNRDIKRKNWTKDIYVYANGNIYWEKGSLASLHKEDILATDWEIVEEPKKTLSEKARVYEDEDGRVVYNSYKDVTGCLLKDCIDECVFLGKDVKEALKEFIEFFGMKHTVYEAKLKEIFGEEFFKEIEKK
jgi:hypothetical protein